MIKEASVYTAKYFTFGTRSKGEGERFIIINYPTPSSNHGPNTTRTPPLPFSWNMYQYHIFQRGSNDTPIGIKISLYIYIQFSFLPKIYKGFVKCGGIFTMV